MAKDKDYTKGSTSRKPAAMDELVGPQERPSMEIRGAQSPKPDSHSRMKLRRGNPDPNYVMFRT